MPATYAALWCKSNFSFLEGASHPDELLEEARRLGVRAVAITDRDGVYGIVRAHEKAKTCGVGLIIGAQMTIDDGSLIVLLVRTHEGYSNLCRLITAGRLRAAKGECAVSTDELCAHAAGLIALLGGDRSLLVRPADPGRTAGDLRDAFGDGLYALVARHRKAEEIEEEGRLRARAMRFDLPLCAGNEVMYHSPARRPLQDVLTCIRHGTTLAQAGRLLKGNAEHDLKSPYAFSALFADDPAAVARSEEIAERCTFSLAEIRYRYPSERLPAGMTSSQWLRTQTLDGARRRYGADIPAAVVRQIDVELQLIDELDYCGYFLTMREVVEFCRRENILCQGRGSAANSVTCYCLEITAVDPIRMGLLFERFISRERAEPPDIDLDIEHSRREEVIQHVYRKYGRTHAAMVANFIRYRGRSAIRDVSKAMDLPADSPNADLQRLVEEIQDFPRHLSIHPGGFLLGHVPIATLVPVENATMPERTVIQWDKDDVEALGLFKVDLLALGALSHMHGCFDLIAQHHGRSLSLATIPAEDTATFDMICRADTVGLFQIESRAQMSMLPRLRPRTYYDLVIQVSIVRPGPITGGMVHPYLRRRNGEEPVEYPHPCLRPVLEKTLGVPLFQEQVMRLAVVAADYTPGEADQLRRDMAAWRRTGRIEQHKERLISRMQKKGIAPEFAERVFKQICGFGEYGFPESHAASFALISYAGAYLKRHYPAAFTCGLLNAQPMGFYAPSTIIDDARRHGVEIRAIDVLASNWDCHMEPLPGKTFAVRMGLRYVKGLGEADGKKILAARRESPFASREDFVRRTGLDQDHQAALAEAGAFSCFGGGRREALWHVQGLSRSEPLPLPVDLDPQPAFAALDEGEIINWDYRRSGHSTHGHPLGPLRAELHRLGLPDARTVITLRHDQRIRYAGIVICRQHPGTAGGVTFMTLEDETGFVNVILWRRVFEQYHEQATTLSFLGVTGKLQVQDGVAHLIAETLWAPQLAAVPAPTVSHDFR